ncbi:hypothetical protein F5Y10DRAFT_263666 [Nemania abortiva]|nr:hypothetical protein F5Y10DRAFT_263666 [Nemania abortiva]
MSSATVHDLRERKNGGVGEQSPRGTEDVLALQGVHPINNKHDEELLGPLPDEEKGRGKRRQNTIISQTGDIEKVEFMDLLFTPGLSSYNNLCFMRRYQLLAAVVGERQNDVEEQIHQVEYAIQDIAARTIISVTRDHSVVRVVCTRNLGGDAIHRAVNMAPVRKDIFDVNLVHTATKETTMALHKSLSSLNASLSAIYKTPLAITGEIILPPNTVGWKLETELRKKVSLDESDDEWDNHEAFYSGYEMEKVQAQDLRRFKGIVKLKIISNTKAATRVRSSGTGWLLDATTVVTSGHCVHSRGRRLVSVDVVIGHGTESPISRPGTHAIAHWSWFRDYETGQDLALIRVAGFEDQQGLRWRPFPEKGKPPNKETLKIYTVGYPSYASEELRRKNESMQKGEDEVECKEAFSSGILKYKTSTWNGTFYIMAYERLLKDAKTPWNAGSPGSPIIDEDDYVVAVHSGRRKSGESSYNAAPVLNEGWNNLDSMGTILNVFATWNYGTKTSHNVVYRLGTDGARLFEMYHL